MSKPYEERGSMVNPQLLEEVLGNGGRLSLDFSNPLHYKHILGFLGKSEEKSSRKRESECKESELMKVVHEQRKLDQHRKRDLSAIHLGEIGNGTENQENSPIVVDENRNQVYIMAPGCISKASVNRTMLNGEPDAEAEKRVLMQSMVSYKEVLAGIATEMKMRDKTTGELISSHFTKATGCKELISSIDGNYNDFKGEKVKYVYGIGTAFFIAENVNQEPECYAEMVADDQYSIMGDDDFIKEFKVIDPSVKREGEKDKIIVSYQRDKQVGEFDYSIVNEPADQKIDLKLPVSFSVTTTDDTTIVDLDRDKGFRLYFDNTEGGQNQYCNTLKNAKIEFGMIGGKQRTITLTLAEDWRSVLDFSKLENKVGVNMKIYGEFNVIVNWNGFNASVGVSFRTKGSSTVEDVRNKLVLPIYMQWGCIGKDTKIKRVNTATHQIEEIQVQQLKINDRVLSLDGRMAEIRDIVTGEDQQIWDIRTDRHSVKLSSTHSISTARGWIPVSDLRTDDLISTEDGLEEIKRLDYVQYEDVVYNFIFEQETPMYGNGIIIGDFDMQQRIRAFYDKKVEFSEKTHRVVEELMALIP